MSVKNVNYVKEICFKSQIKITKNLKSGSNCSAYIFGSVYIMVIGGLMALSDLFI